MSKYKVVDTMALDLLEEQVNSLISDGWEPLGSILLPSKYLPEYHQAMIKRDKLQLSSATDDDDESNTQTKLSQSNNAEPDWTTITNKVVPEIKTEVPMTYTQKQDRLYPDRPINALDFFKNNQALLTKDAYPVSVSLYTSKYSSADRHLHVFVLPNDMQYNNRSAINSNQLRLYQLLYVTQNSAGHYELVMDTDTNYGNSPELNPELFK